MSIIELYSYAATEDEEDESKTMAYYRFVIVRRSWYLETRVGGDNNDSSCLCVKVFRWLPFALLNWIATKTEQRRRTKSSSLNYQ